MLPATFLSLCLLIAVFSSTHSFSIPKHQVNRNNHQLKMSSSIDSGDIYDIPNSGWTSSSWNWGSARGTGHDCAMICRQRWSTGESRLSLVNALINPQQSDFEPQNFEEVKLICGLAWQNGRWDGSDGGPNGGYGEVLAYMAQAERYETKDSTEGSIRLVQDMQERFHKLSPTPEQTQMMDSISVNGESSSQDVDIARRQCTGLVLSAMGFVERGL
mmetsp:Transcript_979/g.1369  ORF Transcript_979/g.1369 Transcript_979/m.1369 type:complete len:216 (-) Transcript_979:550-1197(-)